MWVQKKRLNVLSRETLLPWLRVKRRKCIEFRRMLVDAMPLCMRTVAELSIKAGGRHVFVHAYSSLIKLTSFRQYLEKKSADADKRAKQQATYHQYHRAGSTWKILYKIQRIGSVRAPNLTEIYKEPEEGLSPVCDDETMEY